jgi:hypothetical protein
MARFLLGLLLLAGIPVAVALEQPRYDVIERYNGFELRRYQPYIVAEIVVSGPFETVGNDGFRALAGYIFGKNRQRVSIDMTAPVGQRPVEGERIAMTAPVGQTPTGSDGTYAITFMMPSGYTLDTLPEPLDARIRFRQVDSRIMAARRYSGTWSEKRYRDNEELLRRGMTNANLRAVGQPLWARYNPPITPWFLRRNEVLIEIAPRDAATKSLPESPAR